MTFLHAFDSTSAAVDNTEEVGVLQQVWAKLNAHERNVVYGGAVAVVAWLLGVVLATKSFGSGPFSITVNFFTQYHGMDLGLIAMLASLAAIVVVYLHYAPNASVTLPAPLPTMLLVLSGVSLGCSALMTLLQLTSGIGVGDWPIFAWIAVLGMLAGGGLMTWSAYQSYSAGKAAV